MKKNICMIGFMGSGKSTVSKKLERLLGREEIEMDDYIINKEGMSIPDIFAKFGETYFRQVETEVMRALMQEQGKIISCGGGVVMKDENVAAMKQGGMIIMLDATPETIYERVKDSTDRPLLNGNMNIEHVRGLMAKRSERYKVVADYIVHTDGKTVAKVCEEIIAIVEAAESND
ncbi:MAG: shikimate kinase [Lachnospiraceae bacterium]|nr:shikimate kinase [Lachnospiraceae bacterium]